MSKTFEISLICFSCKSLSLNNIYKVVSRQTLINWVLCRHRYYSNGTLQNAYFGIILRYTNNTREIISFSRIEWGRTADLQFFLTQCEWRILLTWHKRQLNCTKFILKLKIFYNWAFKLQPCLKNIFHERNLKTCQ